MFTQSHPVVNHSFSVSSGSFTSVTDYQNAYDEELRSTCISRMRCPNCHSVGTMKKTNIVYSRQVIGSKEDAFSALKITIQITVFMCTCPTCTQPWHAFLPDWLCPFLHYTYPFLFEILHFFFHKSDEKIAATAREFGLSRTTVRNILKIWEASEIDLNAALQLMNSALTNKGGSASFHFQDYFTSSRMFPDLPDSLIPLFLQLYLMIAGLAFLTPRQIHKCLPALQNPQTGQTVPYCFGMKPPPRGT